MGRNVMKLWIIGIAMAAGFAQAGVNVNNGNFYVTYTDFIVFNAGLPIEVTRTYNSRSGFITGKFGVGWSNEMDSYLKFENKDIVYTEGGGGNILRFAAKGAGNWESAQMGVQGIKKVGNQFHLFSNIGKTYVFNTSGQLIKIQDTNKNYIEYIYEKGSLAKIRDNFNNQVAVTTQDIGGFSRIKSIKYADKKAHYEYSKTGDLTSVVAMDGVKYAYNYDDEHNLTKIAYANGTTKTMAYNKVRDYITSFKDIDNSTINYEYFSDTLDPENRFGTSVTRKDSTGKTDNAKFWYEFRKRKDNSRYAYRTVTAYGNEATETLLTECCGTPITITQWALGNVGDPSRNLSWTQPSGKRLVTKFEYYQDGTLKKKYLPNGSAISLAYDPATRKISSLEKNGTKVEYAYDGHKNLASAKDFADKLKMDFTYDIQGRVTIVKETPLAKANKNRSLYFKYNNDGLPVEVKEKNYDGKVSLIKLTYFPNGQVKQVLNGSGRNIASQSEISTTQRIYNTFQRVLEIIQPVGVSLSAEGTI